MEYELVLGLEIHLQLNTKSKMFCTCVNDPFGSDKPNIYTCPVCLGLPGALPVPNREAIKKAQKLAYVLSGNLCSEITFERKNYFYPDLAKGYQITCPHYPISKEGSYDLSFYKDNFKVEFMEVHLEEDTAKSIHKGSETYIDFNKSGVPLLEIVTSPVFSDIDLAVSFCKELQSIARRLGVSEADLEKGNMRLEPNISLRKKGVKELPNYKVEIKNINSFSFLKKAINYEILRQTEILISGGKVDQETRGFVEKSSKTVSQRQKEFAHDYRYFPEPDIPTITFNKSWINLITKDLVNTLSNQRNELLTKYGLPKNYIEILIDDDTLLNKFYELVNGSIDPAKSADLVINKAEYKQMSAQSIISLEQEKKSRVMLDKQSTLPYCSKAINDNEGSVIVYKEGNKSAKNYLVGEVMKSTMGAADPKIVSEVLSELLDGPK